jgi:hypothetical protein
MAVPRSSSTQPMASMLFTFHPDPLLCGDTVHVAMRLCLPTCTTGQGAPHGTLSLLRGVQWAPPVVFAGT